MFWGLETVLGSMFCFYRRRDEASRPYGKVLCMEEAMASQDDELSRLRRYDVSEAFSQ